MQVGFGSERRSEHPHKQTQNRATCGTEGQVRPDFGLSCAVAFNRVARSSLHGGWDMLGIDSGDGIYHKSNQ